MENSVRCSEKPKLDNARQLRGIFFIEPNDEEFKLSSNALQNTDKEQRGNPPQYWETQDEIRLRRKHETKARRSWTQTSSRCDAQASKIPDAKAAVEK